MPSSEGRPPFSHTNADAELKRRLKLRRIRLTENKVINGRLRKIKRSVSNLKRELEAATPSTRNRAIAARIRLTKNVNGKRIYKTNKELKRELNGPNTTTVAVGTNNRRTNKNRAIEIVRRCPVRLTVNHRPHGWLHRICNVHLRVTLHPLPHPVSPAPSLPWPVSRHPFCLAFASWRPAWRAALHEGRGRTASTRPRGGTRRTAAGRPPDRTGTWRRRRRRRRPPRRCASRTSPCRCSAHTRRPQPLHTPCKTACPSPEAPRARAPA